MILYVPAVNSLEVERDVLALIKGSGKPFRESEERAVSARDTFGRTTDNIYEVTVTVRQVENGKQV